MAKSDNKNSKLSKVLSKPLLLAAVLFAVIGYIFLVQTYAAPGGKGGGNVSLPDPASSSQVRLYLDPYISSVKRGSNITVAVKIDTEGQPVNAVQADLTYPANSLEFVSIDSSGSPFELALIQTGGSGNIQIVRGSTGKLVGDQLVARVTFKALAAKGNAAVSFANTSSAVNADTNTEILQAKFNASYKLTR